MSTCPAPCCCCCCWPAPAAVPLVIPSTLCTGFNLQGTRVPTELKQHYSSIMIDGMWIAVLKPLFLRERLLPHGQMLLVFHQSEKRWAGLDSQSVIVVFRIAPKRREKQSRLSFLLWNLRTYTFSEFICTESRLQLKGEGNDAYMFCKNK